MRASLLTMAGAPDLKNKHGETPENTAKSERKMHCVALEFNRNALRFRRISVRN